MKMAKKLLAVVLTGVMAVSMLTGCALSDKIKANALEDALNSDQVKTAAKVGESTAEKETKYDYKSALNSIAGDAWKDENGMKSGKVDNFATTYVGKLAAYTKNTTKYFVYVVDVTDVKTSNKSEWTTRAVDLRKAVKSALNSIAGDAWKDENGMKSGKVDNFATTYVGKLAAYTKNTTKYFVYVVDVTDVKTSNKSEWTTRAVDLRKAVTVKGFGTTATTIKDYNADATNKTAKFGIDFKNVTTGEGSSKKTTDYAIVVFEAGANS